MKMLIGDLHREVCEPLKKKTKTTPHPSKKKYKPETHRKIKFYLTCL